MVDKRDELYYNDLIQLMEELKKIRMNRTKKIKNKNIRGDK
jgi:hypothetical protein